MIFLTYGTIPGIALKDWMWNTLMRPNSLWTKTPVRNLPNMKRNCYIDKFDPTSGVRQFLNCSVSILIKIMCWYSNVKLATSDDKRYGVQQDSPFIHRRNWNIVSVVFPEAFRRASVGLIRHALLACEGKADHNNHLAHRANKSGVSRQQPVRFDRAPSSVPVPA